VADRNPSFVQRRRTIDRLGGIVRGTGPTGSTPAIAGAVTTTASAQPSKSDAQRLQDELDDEAKTFDPADAAFLRDLRGVWKWDFNPGDAVNEAHAMCALPKGQTASALQDIVNMIDPGNDGSASFTTMDEATKFMGVAGRHFCPGK
jgi:Protein of unknown function (DUF732)